MARFLWAPAQDGFAIRGMFRVCFRRACHRKILIFLEMNPLLFASHIRHPEDPRQRRRSDEDYQYAADIEPLLKLLPEPKRLVLFESGHIPPLEEVAPVMNQFLDEVLGPASRS